MLSLRILASLVAAATPLLAHPQLLPPPFTTTPATPLRILPLGASVTYGVGSTTGNSYRKALRSLLGASGHPVNLVGRRQNGDFTDNQVEATSGYVLSQITTAALEATPLFLPNVALIDAGTNNCNAAALIPDMGANMTALIRALYEQSPGITVILATLLENKVAAQEVCRVDVNGQYREVARVMEGEGRRFVLVDMRGEKGPTTADLFDTRHPNDAGYEKMAVVWFEGIMRAREKGFLEEPAENGVPLDGGDDEDE